MNLHRNSTFEAKLEGILARLDGGRRDASVIAASTEVDDLHAPRPERFDPHELAESRNRHPSAIGCPSLLDESATR